MIACDEVAPPPALRALVRCFWVLSASRAGFGDADPAIPDGSPELIVSLADPMRARATSGRWTTQPRVMLVGQISRPLAVRPTGRVTLVAARLVPHGAAWFAPDAAALTDRWIALGGAWARVRRAMAQARGTPGRIALLGAALARHHASRAGADARVVRAVERLVASHGTADVGALAREVATTPRHLQRLFARDVGVSPKHLARIRRVQHVFAAWRDRPRAWAQVAAECGYVDQAHLARDMRAIAGGAPAGLVASMTAFTRAFTPLGTGARRVGWPDASPRRRHAVR